MCNIYPSVQIPTSYILRIISAYSFYMLNEKERLKKSIPASWICIHCLTNFVSSLKFLLQITVYSKRYCSWVDTRLYWCEYGMWIFPVFGICSRILLQWQGHHHQGKSKHLLSSSKNNLWYTLDYLDSVPRTGYYWKESHEGGSEIETRGFKLRIS